MAEEAPGAAPEPTRLQKAKKAYSVVGDILTPSRIALFLAAIILAVTGLFGGWEAATATDDALPVVEAGEPQELAPFEIAVERIRYGDELPGVAWYDEEHRHLFLVVSVTNTTSDPVLSSLLSRSVTLEADGLEATPGGLTFRPQVFRGNDGLPARNYQPGVATPSVLIWKQQRSEPVPDEIKLTLNAFTWRYSIAEESDGWFDEEPAATLTLPLEPMADA